MTEYITKNMLQELKQELEFLVEKKRPEILEALKRARAFGDLSENAEYTECRKEQSKNESRISEIEVRLKNIEVIDRPKAATNVQIGSIVEITSKQDGNSVKYEIVSENSADIEKSRISDKSPIGSGLLGKKVGDSFTFSSPSGNMKYTVESIE